MHSVEWAAGLFEGEGCITTTCEYRKGVKYSYPQLALRMTDQDVVMKFAEIFPVAKVYELSAEQCGPCATKSQFCWQVRSKEKVRLVLSAMLPYFGNRRAYKALNVLDDIELKS